MSDQEKANAIMAKVNSIFTSESVGNTVANLYFRWQDEKEYEDWKDYDRVMRDSLQPFGVTFVKSSKRPFGFRVRAIVEDIFADFQFSISSKGDYQWKRVRHGRM